MSFSKSKSKRFADPVSQAPPVGFYDITKGGEKSTGPVTFDQGTRFTEKRDQTPGPADTQPTLNQSSASLNSTCSFATPSKPVKRSVKQKSSSITDLSCKETLAQQISHLQYRIIELEKNLQRSVKDKSVAEKNFKMACKEKEELLNHLEEMQNDNDVSIEQVKSELEACQKEISRLKQENIELECLKKNLEADLDLERQNEDALKQQILNLDMQKSEMITQIAELEMTISQLQALLDQVRYDKRLTDEDLLNVATSLKENESILVTLQARYEEEQAEMSRLKQELENQKCQTEAAKMNVDRLEKRLEEVSIEKQSVEDNCFNLERSKQLLEEQNIKLNDDISRIRNEKVKLEEQLESLENSTTESLRSLSLKCQDLEDLNASMKEEFEKKEELMQSELEITKQSWFSCKNSLEMMKNSYAALQHDLDTVTAEANDYAKRLHDTECTVLGLKAENEELNRRANETRANHETEREFFVANIEQLKDNMEEKDKEIQNQKDEISDLQSIIAGLEEEKDLLYKRINQVNEDIQKKNEQIRETKCEMQNALTAKEESIKQITEELGSILKAEQDKYSKLLVEHERLLTGDHIEALNNESATWRKQFEDLEAKVRPFQNQLELYEQEKVALLSENDWKESEMAKLAERYAQILGHQNNKQKIHHIVKIKEENLSLKKEVSKLRAQVSREKLSKNGNLKVNSPKTQRKPRFDPSKAFQHAGKENENIKPLTELTDADMNTTANW